ncbi:MAG: hypothetical protein COA82_09860 [Alkaliphilus sp.]|jgi:CxxC motif-containing protein|nr:DUF1667 domain-containing protein [bacterium AH-315-K05]MBN4063133.1 DUF1667 domain-containing protein [Alkaliphilus sp. AH-315-G20]MBN4074319.1 DUF1667 domain-containing protein [bacterium AH-315-E09]PHS31773.1 MAG: hypothetical protein COA82_09860 [Alkaliphilus sp.]
MRALICIACPVGCKLKVELRTHQKEALEDKWAVEGNLCDKGIEFAKNELTNPKRVICSTVKTIFKELPRLPVRTDGEIPKEQIFALMKEINLLVLEHPVTCGEVVLENVLNTGVNIIATMDMLDWQLKN